MALEYKEINQLDPAGAIDDADLLEIEQGGQSKKISRGSFQIDATVVIESAIDYAMADNEIYGTYFMTTGAAMKTFTFPDATANKGKEITVMKVESGIGALKLLPKGADTLIGSEFVLFFEEGDVMTFRASGTDWKRISGIKRYYYSGWINTADWTNRHLGFVTLPYDNPLLGTLEIGDKVTGGTNGSTGIIIDDTAGVLILAAVVGGGGNIFDNDEVLTGTRSAATVDVDLVGDFKNVDSNVFHGWGKNLREVEKQLFISSDGTENNSFEIAPYQRSGDIGYTPCQIDNNNIKKQSGSGGLTYSNDAGAAVTLAAQNWFYNGLIKEK